MGTIPVAALKQPRFIFHFNPIAYRCGESGEAEIEYPQRRISPTAFDKDAAEKGA